MPNKHTQAWDNIFFGGRVQRGISNTNHPPYRVEKSPPMFCTATETVADLENADLHCNPPGLLHKLDDMAEAIVREAMPTLQMELAGLTRDPYLRRPNSKQAAYIDVSVYTFLGLA